MRFKRRAVAKEKIEYIETGTCLFTFEGKILPREVFIFGLETRIEPYVMRVTQCYNCLLFGHVKSQCRSKSRCQKCAVVHEGVCAAPERCFHCNSSDHLSTNKNCPEFSRQKQIRQYMSLNSISFYEADMLVPKLKKDPFIRFQKDFPALQSNTQKSISNFTPNNSNREYFTQMLQNNSQTPSYSRVTSYKRQKPRSPSPQPGYNREDHQACLFQSPARYRSTPIISSNSSPAFIPDTPPNTASRNQESALPSDMPQNIFNSKELIGMGEDILRLSAVQKDMVKRYIQSLKNPKGFSRKDEMPAGSRLY